MKRSAVTAAALLLAACFVDIAPLVGGDAGMGMDASSDASIDVVTCSSIDAGCLPAVPPGWVPWILPANSGACPSGFRELDLVTNPQLASGDCNCTCSVSGAWDCASALLSFETGVSCGTKTSIPAGTCFPFSSTAWGFEAYPTAVGNPVCNTPAQVAKVQTTPLPTCAPLSCDVDVCAATGHKCIASSGAMSCPAGFPNQVLAGIGATGTCPKCGCTVSPAPSCTGLLLLYSNGTCSNASVGFEGSPGMCQPDSYNVSSVKYNVSVDASTGCTTQQTGTSSTSLQAEVTICCVN